MPEVDDDRSPIKTALLKLDYIGMVIFAAATVALLLALQFGGYFYRWKNHSFDNNRARTILRIHYFRPLQRQQRPGA